MSDLISRQAAIDAANRADYDGFAIEHVRKVTDEVIKEILKIPSADRKGHWREITAEEDEEMAFLGLVECTNCGLKGAFNCNYCPSCGADMRGENNDER